MKLIILYYHRIIIVRTFSITLNSKHFFFFFALSIFELLEIRNFSRVRETLNYRKLDVFTYIYIYGNDKYV